MSSNSTFDLLVNALNNAFTIYKNAQSSATPVPAMASAPAMASFTPPSEGQDVSVADAEQLRIEKLQAVQLQAQAPARLESPPEQAPVAEQAQAPVAEQAQAPVAEQAQAPVAEQAQAPVAEQAPVADLTLPRPINARRARNMKWTHMSPQARSPEVPVPEAPQAPPPTDIIQGDITGQQTITAFQNEKNEVKGYYPPNKLIGGTYSSF